jgi:hypothetical protein
VKSSKSRTNRKQSREIAKLRKTLEQERMARKQRGGNEKPFSNLNEDPTQGSAVSEIAAKIRRRSSAKDLTGRSNTRAQSILEDDFDQVCDENQQRPRYNLTNRQTTRSKASIAASRASHRRHSEESLLEHINRKNGIGMEDLTSAFILPDFTMHIPAAAADPTAKLAAETQEAFDSLSKHDGQNCTVCKRVIEHGSNHAHGRAGKATINIPKPVPVSERMPEAAPYEEEPTIRPSQSPAVALATVLKGLEDELAHLKMRHSQYQALYNQHDPSLSKRNRKSLFLKINDLLKTIDVKADQIYSLYDVVEGQKAAGYEMNEEEFELTIQSIGIDLTNGGLKGRKSTETEERRQQRREMKHIWENQSGNENPDELPWEGFGSTIESRGPSVFAGRRSSWGV